MPSILLAVTIVLAAPLLAAEGPERTNGPADVLRIVAEVPPGASAAGLRLERRTGERTDLVAATITGDEWTRRIDAPIACSEQDTYVVQSSSLFGTTLPGMKCSDAMRVRLHQRATMRIQLRAPEGSRVPASGVMRVDNCDAVRPELVAIVPFAIERGTAEIPLPAGCVQPQILAGDFAPLQLRRISLAPGKVHQAGSQTLRRGAALLARALSSEDLRPLSGIEVSVVAADDADAIARSAADGRLPRPDGRTSSDGWVRLYGITPGNVIVALRSPHGRFPQFSAPYELRAGQETLLDRLLFDPPGSLRVTVAVQEDVRAAMTLDSIAATSESGPWPPGVALTAPVDQQNTSYFEELPPGRWRIVASGRIGRSQPSELGHQFATIHPGADAAAAITITDRLYRGTVTLAGEPRQGRFYLRPVKDSTRRIAAGEADSDGEFSVVLEGPGDYRVQFQTENSVITPLRAYTFADPDRSVRIDLPAETIAGRVIDRDGQPVSGAFVEARLRDDSAGLVRVNARASADGTFVLEGVDAGAWRLHAETGSRRTAETRIEVLTHTHVRNVTLAFGAEVEVVGRVLGANGAPLAGTYVQVVPSALVRATGLSDTTLPSGEFRISVPDAQPNTSAAIWFITDDQIVGSVRRTLSEPVQIRVPANTGAIRLRRESSWRSKSVHGRFVTDDGSFFPFMLGAKIESSIADRQDVLVLNRVIPGTWRYVEARTPAELALLERGEAVALPVVATLVVRPGEVAEAFIEQR
jgi:hypothetical protein